MPTGVLTRVAPTVSATLPKMALRRPPALSGGGVICVKMVRLMALPPFQIRVPRIQTSQASPNSAAAIATLSAIRLIITRRA